MNIFNFGTITVGSLFGCFGDTNLNYEYPKWVIAKKIAEDKAVEVYKDKSEQTSFYMNISDKVTYYESWEDIKW
jgi:hypothetical protein